VVAVVLPLPPQMDWAAAGGGKVKAARRPIALLALNAARGATDV
jgi:hypothetical protein